MTDRNLAIRVALVIVAIMALLGLPSHFATNNGDNTTIIPRAVPSVATRVGHPSQPRLDDDRLTGPSRLATPLAAPLTIVGQLEPLDATAFRYARALIRLKHLMGPSRDAVCQGDDGALWSCGLQARVALVNALRSDAARCLPALDTPGDKNSFQCWVGDEDLSRIMIRKGWARPMPLHRAGYTAELDAAIAEKAGLWRGEWPVNTSTPLSRFDGRAQAR